MLQIQNNRPFTLQRFAKFIAAAAILYIGALILTPFPYYLPPDFDRGFLRGKSDFFYSGGYFVGFYAHIFTAPVGLLIGTLQLSRTVRTAWPRVHERLGQTYVGLVLIGIAPGGLVMATRSYGGLSSILCFGLISLFMWIATFIAWRRARQKRYRDHGRWMMRSYTLMCSAIMLRLISYALSGTNLGHMLSYQLAAWLSWIPAAIALEIILLRSGNAVTRRSPQNRSPSSQ